MVKKVTTYLLCVILAWTSVIPVYAEKAFVSTNMTEQEIRNKYPDAEIIHIDPDSYSQLAENLRERGYSPENEIRLAESNSNNIETRNPEQKTRLTSGDCNDSSLNKNTKQTDDSVNAVVDISDGLLKSGNGGSGDGAVVVFVIIGAILIVVWALYVFKYLYDLAAGFKPCDTWYEFTFSSSSISDSPDTHFETNGLRFLTGFRDGNTDVGIAFEFGESDILLTEQQSLKLDGYYWMLGPTLRWRLSPGHNPHYIHMNFMGGTTEHDEIGVIAKATLGLQFAIGKHFHLGFNWGALNINLHDNPAILSDREQYHYLYGVNTGYRF